MTYAFSTHVSEKHIAQGIRRDCRLCPIALSAEDALLPALRNLKNVRLSVSATGVLRIFSGTDCVAFRAPWAARFIGRFDDFEHVASQSFFWEQV